MWQCALRYRYRIERPWAAVLALALGAAFADRSIARFATIGATLYLDAHAGLHAFMDLTGGQSIYAAWAEAPGVYLPAILASFVAERFRRRKVSARC